jgi:signal transduction histidine kinase
VAAGDVVEVAGFPVFSGYKAALEDAAFRVVGHSAPVPPTVVTLDKALSGDWQAELITMRGRVVENTRGSGGQRIVVQSGAQTFRAVLSQPPFAQLEPGAFAEFTGVCLAEGLRYQDDEGWRPQSLELLLQSNESVTLLAHPSRWTAQRVELLLASAAAILVIALVWAAALQFQVRKQTARIRSQVEREAVLEERNRIAREIHDTLAQAFAGTSFQLEAVAAELKFASPVCRAHLEHARAMVRHGLAQARRSVTEMRGQSAAARAGLGDLKECAELLASDSDARLHIETAGEPYTLSPLAENNVLRIAQEGVINALRHANPRNVWLKLDYGADCLRVEVADDGCGFDVDRALEAPGHFGLIGMRERAREANGELNVTTTPGKGTRIVIAVHRPHPIETAAAPANLA